MQKDGIHSISNVQQLRLANSQLFDEVLLVEAGSEFVDPNHEIRDEIAKQFHLSSTKKIFEIYELASYIK
jgi:hypothetical protein